MTATATFEHRVKAYNVSHASENKIHDDAVAKKLGFSGGLVPGVEVFAYATHPALSRWGRAWLERGRMEAKFAKPVYDGRIAVVTANANDDRLDILVESEGQTCATARASLTASAPSAPDVSAYRQVAPPPQSGRPPADETSLAEGRWLGTVPAVLTAERHAEYLRDVRETHRLYAAEGLAHPGILLRLCNSLLRENVVLAPWIHVGSVLQNLTVARVGEVLSARGRIVANYERKGHRLVDIDCLLLAGERPVAHVLHTAIYRLRHLAQA